MAPKRNLTRDMIGECAGWGQGIQDDKRGSRETWTWTSDVISDDKHHYNQPRGPEGTGYAQEEEIERGGGCYGEHLETPGFN